MTWPRTAEWVGILRGSGGKIPATQRPMDTVGTEGMAAPFSAEIRDGKLYGRQSGHEGQFGSDACRCQSDRG